MLLRVVFGQTRLRQNYERILNSLLLSLIEAQGQIGERIGYNSENRLIIRRPLIGLEVESKPETITLQDGIRQGPTRAEDSFSSLAFSFPLQHSRILAGHQE
jgi:hypothetical protein